MQQYIFYNQGLITTVVMAGDSASIFRTTELCLFEKHSNFQSFTPTNNQRSVVGYTDGGHLNLGLFSYTPYGHRTAHPHNRQLLAYCGERLDNSTRGYNLGNGYRMFSPSLMRFNSPDSLSPFGKGGMNSYCYCSNDPINHTDPSGRSKGRQQSQSKTSVPRKKSIETSLKKNADNNSVSQEKSLNQNKPLKNENQTTISLKEITQKIVQTSESSELERLIHNHPEHSDHIKLMSSSTLRHVVINEIASKPLRNPVLLTQDLITLNNIMNSTELRVGANGIAQQPAELADYLLEKYQAVRTT